MSDTRISEYDGVPPRLWRLMDAHLNDTISEDEMHDLEALLMASDGASRTFVEYTRVHAELHLLAAARRAEADTLARDQRRSVAVAQSPLGKGRKRPAFSVVGFLNGLLRTGYESPSANALTWLVMAILCSGMVMTVFFCILLVYRGVNVHVDVPQTVTTQPAPVGNGRQPDGARRDVNNRDANDLAVEDAASGPLDSPVNVPAAPVATVARLIRTYDCRWTIGSHSPRLGDDLAPGRKLILRSGLAEVLFESGVRAVLQGPATVEIGSRSNLVLQQGKLTVRVDDPDARGFVVLAPGMKYTDLGTEFGVFVAKDGSQEMHVFRGTVRAEVAANLTSPVIGRGAGVEGLSNPKSEISNPSSLVPHPAPLILTANQAIRVTAPAGASKSHERIEPIAADESRFVRADRMKQIVIEQSPEWRLWKQFSAELRKRQDLVAYYDFQPDGDQSILRNRAATGPQFDGRLVGGAEWCEGRFPGKQAIQFDKLHSGVRVNIRTDCKELTLVAWMNVDRLLRPLAALLNSDGAARPGELHWQITRAGKLEFNPHVISDGNAASGAGSDEAVVEPRSRRWASTAVVYDSATGKIAFYYDGALVRATTLSTKAAPPVRFGEGMIGGWDPREYSFGDRDRPLEGRIDELMIFNKALSAEEIRKIHEATQP